MNKVRTEVESLLLTEMVEEDTKFIIDECDDCSLDDLTLDKKISIFDDSMDTAFNNTDNSFDDNLF